MKIRFKDYGYIDIPEFPTNSDRHSLELYAYELETVNNILINIIRKQEKLLDDCYDI